MDSTLESPYRTSYGILPRRGKSNHLFLPASTDVESFGAPYVLLLTLASTNVGGSTKKAVTNGCVWIGYNVGNIASSYSVIASEKNVKYRSAWITLLVATAFTTIASLVLRWMYRKENKKRGECLVTLTEVSKDSSPHTPHGDGEKEAESESGKGDFDKKKDLTDWENKAFRYTL